MTIARVLASCASRVVSHPGRVALIAVLATAVSVFLALRLKVSTDISILMPSHSRVSGAFLQTLQDFGRIDQLIIAIQTDRETEGDRHKIKNVAAKLASKLERSRLFSEISHGISPEMKKYLDERQHRYPFHFASAEQLESLHEKLSPEAIERRVKKMRRDLLLSPFSMAMKERMLLDPLGLQPDFGEGYGRLAGFSFDLSDGHFFSPDGRVLVLFARPVKPSQDTRFDARMLRELALIMKELGGTGSFSGDYSMKIGEDLKVSLIGPYVETLYGTRVAVRDVFLSSALSLLCLMILFAAVYRSWQTLVLLVIPLVAGITWALGIASIFAGHLTMITAGFAAMLAGLGVDTGIHIIERIKQENRNSPGIRQAIEEAFAVTGRGVLAAALTSAAIFFTIAFSDFSALREFGLIIGFGMLATLLSMLFFLPALIIVLSDVLEKRKASLRILPPRLSLLRVRWLLARPRTVAVLGLVFTLVMAYSASRLRFEQNIYKLAPANRSYEENKRHLLSSFKGSTNMAMAIASAEDLQELLETTERIGGFLEGQKRSSAIDSFESLSFLLPSRRSQRKVIDEARKWDLQESMSVFMRSLKENAFPVRPFEPFVENVLQYSGEAPGLITLDNLKDSPAEKFLQRFLVQVNGKWKSVTYIYPKTGDWEDRIPPAIIQGLERQGENITVTGIVPSFNEIISFMKREFKELSLVALIVVYLITLLFLRKPLTAALALLSTILGLIWTLGMMRMFGLNLNLVTMLVVPMIFGLGIDYAIHLLNHHGEKGAGHLDQTLKDVSGAIIMTAMTTIIGFGSLAFSASPSLVHLGGVVSCGIACSAVTALILIPALMTVFRARP